MHLCQSKNIPAKFFLILFRRGRPDKFNKNNMSSDSKSVSDPKKSSFLLHSLVADFTWFDCTEHLINLLVVLLIRSRCSARSCMEHAWLRKNCTQRSAALPVRTIAITRLADFIERRRHQVCCSVTSYR